MTAAQIITVLGIFAVGFGLTVLAFRWLTERVPRAPTNVSSRPAPEMMSVVARSSSSSYLYVTYFGRFAS